MAQVISSEEFNNLVEHIEGIAVESNVGAQPVNEEILQGAKNRIKNLKKYQMKMKNMKYSYAYILLYIHNCIFLFLLFSNFKVSTYFFTFYYSSLILFQIFLDLQLTYLFLKQHNLKDFQLFVLAFQFPA